MKAIDFMVIIFGILGWIFLAWFIWAGLMSYLNGSEYAVIRWNVHNELFIEFILINGIIVLMSIYLIIKIKNKIIEDFKR